MRFGAGIFVFILCGLTACHSKDPVTSVAGDAPVAASAPVPATPTPAKGELIRASTAGDLARVRDLISRGADVNENLGTIEGQDVTPLLAASASGRTDVAKLLIASGAALYPNFRGATARDLAVVQGDAELLGAILDVERKEEEKARR